MNRLDLTQFPKSTEADLRKLVEPLASYISATSRPLAALIVALILLVSNLQEINDAANNYLPTFGENHIG
jgi:hypothetical protein